MHVEEVAKTQPQNAATCDLCKKPAAILLAYGPHNYCETHFTRFFENRFRKTIRKYKLFKPKEKIVIALSGGKDSVVLTHLLHKYYAKSNDLHALIIDEGVHGYRDKSITIAQEHCKKRNIPCTTVAFKEEFGITNDTLMPLILANPKLGGTCAFCGTLRRNIMNKYAKKLGADKLATGHNLDDEVQSFVMNVFNNDFERMKRMHATSGIIDHEGFVKRIKPLYETPEKEIVAYCAMNDITHYSQECCPYSWTAKRNEYREMLTHFENRFPGTQYSILRFFENIQPLVRPSKSEAPLLAKSLHACTTCGEPTEREVCKACEMISTIKLELKKKKPGKARDTTKYNKGLTCYTTKNRK